MLSNALLTGLPFLSTPCTDKGFVTTGRGTTTDQLVRLFQMTGYKTPLTRKSLTVNGALPASVTGELMTAKSLPPLLMITNGTFVGSWLRTTAARCARKFTGPLQFCPSKPT